MSRNKIAWLITSIWVITLFALIFLKFDEFVKLKLNETGDFLAGATAPLAFLWIIIGYFQQNEDLKLNNEALQVQIKELRISIEHQEELVKVTQEDIKLSKQEIKKRDSKERREAQPDFNFLMTRGGGAQYGGTVVNSGSKQQVSLSNLIQKNY